MRSLTGNVTAPCLFFFYRQRDLTGRLTEGLAGRLIGNLTGSGGSTTVQQCVDVAVMRSENVLMGLVSIKFRFNTIIFMCVCPFNQSKMRIKFGWSVG